jgi:murein DD-endopeptidase MepM/ murein hydrolase activator NlpD
VIIAHADGSSLYAHMMASTVVPGQSVRAGQVIGFVGMTGRTFGPHLHLEYYPVGASLSSPYGATDPVVWMARHGTQL